MTINPQYAIGIAWGALGMVWLAGVFFTKRTVRSQPGGGRLFQLALVLLGFLLLSGHFFEAGWLGHPIVPHTQVTEFAAVILTVCGCLFAIWARLTLGANWSGRATVKSGHELITSGPYGLARHPIYTGLLTAAMGSGLAVGQVRSVLGFALVVLALAIKIGQEERLMLQTFPVSYAAYRLRVKALIPGVF